MGDEEQDALYAERRAALEREFAALPAPSTDAYWAALADPALPMEVLVRCLRERLKGGNGVAAARIYERVLLRVQRSNEVWAKHVLRIAGREQAAVLMPELLQELSLALWQDLKSERKFLEVGFHHALNYLCKHVAQTFMQREGLWKRKGVATPERVPRSLIESLTPPEEDDSGEPGTGARPRQLPADPTAEAEFNRVEVAEAVQELLDILPPHLHEQLHLTFWSGMTQTEMAAHFGITDRAIRLRFEKALALIRAYLNRRGGPHD